MSKDTKKGYSKFVYSLLHFNIFLNARNRSYRPMSSRSHIVERLNVEKTNDGRAGMTIFGGIFIAAYCHVILLVMSGIFMVAGSLLTAISYRPKAFGEDLHHFYIRQVVIV